MTAGAAGAAKALTAAEAARVHVETGSGRAIPATGARSTTAGEEWKWTYTALAFGQLNTWKGNNGTKGASFLWFEAAKAVTAATANWWTAYDGTQDAEEE